MTIRRSYLFFMQRGQRGPSNLLIVFWNYHIHTYKHIHYVNSFVNLERFVYAQVPFDDSHVVSALLSIPRLTHRSI
jgi:hypothetical protein